MPEFLNTSELTRWIPTIIREAQNEIVILAPYIQTSDLLYSELIDANRRGVEIIIIYRENKINDVERDKLLKIANLNLMHHPNLHAKCYMNEDHIIITSMNMYEFSEKNNREMGIVFINEVHTKIEQWNSDKIEVIEDIIVEIQTIVNGSHMERASKETNDIGFQFEILKTRKEINEDICLKLNNTFLHKRFTLKETNRGFYPYCQNIIDRLDLTIDGNRSIFEFSYPTKRIEDIFERFKPSYNEFMIEGFKYYWNAPNQPIYLYLDRYHASSSNIQSILDDQTFLKFGIERLTTFIKQFI